MRLIRLFNLFIAMGLAGPAAAGPIYFGSGVLPGTTDLSGLTGTLENGVAANVLGGLGSGLTYAGGNTFLAVPDRGPNATPYNSAIDDTTSYISRVQTLTIGLTANATGSAQPFTVTPTLTGTTLLSSPTALTYGSGAGLGNRSDGSPIGSGAPAQNGSGGLFLHRPVGQFRRGQFGHRLERALRPGGDPGLQRWPQRLYL